VGITSILIFIIVIAYNSLSTSDSSSSMLRIMTLLGGNMPLGLIQAFTFFLFFYAMIEISGIFKELRFHEKAFAKNLLPEKDNWVLSPNDVAQLKLDVMAYEKREKSMLSRLIIMVCGKYRTNKSTSEAMELLSAQIKINRENDESSQSLIRYVIWAIPSVGFIGTVIGIAQSLGAVKQNMSGDDLVNVTSALNVAFDTTLVALFLSLIMMFFYHRLQERQERLHSKTEQYILENLINRIYHS